MGKAKRFNSYDSIVAESRKVTQAYGQARQDLSIKSFRSMPQEPPVINAGIFGLRGEGTGEYLTVSLAADQTTNIGANDHVEFDTKDEDGGIELQTGAGQSDGIFELLSGRKYIISAQLRPEFSGTTGQLVVAWYDRTNAAELGSRAIYTSQTGSAHNANQPLAEIIVTPDTNIDVEVRIVQVTALTALANQYCTANLFEISLGGFGAISGGGSGSGVSFPLTPDVNTIGSVSGAQTINLSLSDSHYSTITLTGDVTFTFSNPPASGKEMSFVIDILQDGTGGHTITWPGSVRKDPIVGSGIDTRTVVVGSTVDGGTNYDVLIVTGGSSTSGANKALSNLSAVAINTNLLADNDDQRNLGSAAKEFKDLFIDGTANIDSLALTTGSTVTVIRDEDNMSSDSDTSLATQQSIKAYVDSVPSSANKQLSNLSGTVAVNLNLLPNQGTGGSLGSGVSTEEWFNLYVQKVRFPVKSTLAVGSNIIQTVNNSGNDDMVFNVISSTADRFLWTMNGVNQLVLTSTELVCSGVNVDMENNNITDVNQLQITGSSGDTVFGLLDGQTNVFDIQNPNPDGVIRLFCDDTLGATTQIMELNANGTNSNIITFNKDGSSLAILDDFGVLRWGVTSGTQPTITVNVNGLDLNVGTGDVFDVQINSVSEYLFTTTALDMQNNSILDTDRLAFLDVNTDITDTSPGLQYDVPSSESHQFRVNNSAVAQFNDTSTTLTDVYLEMDEVSAPSAGDPNTARVFFEDNGSGKTRMMVQFQAGAAQQIAIQP